MLQVLPIQERTQVNETFEQFCERMSHVEKTDEFVVGRAHEGNSRAVFAFEGHQCFLESWGYRRIPDLNKRRGEVTPAEMFWVASANPKDDWVHGEWVKGKKACEALAKKYGGRACPDEYHEDDQDAWYLRFDTFEQLMKLLWDYRTGVLPVETFPWKAGLAA
jgi:hypothetical protein